MWVREHVCWPLPLYWSLLQPLLWVLLAVSLVLVSLSLTDWTMYLSTCLVVTALATFPSYAPTMSG